MPVQATMDCDTHAKALPLRDFTAKPASTGNTDSSSSVSGPCDLEAAIPDGKARTIGERSNMRPFGCVLLLCLTSVCGKAQWYGGGVATYAYPPFANANVTVAYPPPSTSVVIVNHETTPPPPTEKTYMIAFKGGFVRLAGQYWVDGSTLNYVTPDHERRTEPVESVDRALSERLNREQGLLFTLPPVVAQAEASRQQPDRVASSAVRKRRACPCR